MYFFSDVKDLFSEKWNQQHAVLNITWALVIITVLYLLAYNVWSVYKVATERFTNQGASALMNFQCLTAGNQGSHCGAERFKGGKSQSMYGTLRSRFLGSGPQEIEPLMNDEVVQYYAQQLGNGDAAVAQNAAAAAASAANSASVAAGVANAVASGEDGDSVYAAMAAAQAAQAAQMAAQSAQAVVSNPSDPASLTAASLPSSSNTERFSNPDTNDMLVLSMHGAK